MEPIAKRTRSNSNKKRKYLVELPFDVRYEILKWVDTLSKLKFSRCSKQCYQDVAKFRNYIKEVRVADEFANVRLPLLGICPIRMTITFDDMESVMIFFGSTVEIRLFRCKKVYDDESEGFIEKWELIKQWNIKVKNEYYYSTIARHFGYIMKHCSNSQFDLNIYRKDFPYEKMNLTGLKKLKSIRMPYMPYDIDFIGRGILNMEQIYKIEEEVNLVGVVSSVQQLQHLQAKNIVLKSKNFSSKDVNDYIKLFMNGEIHENVGDVQWLTMKGELKFDEVINGFDVINKFDVIR